MRVLLGIWVAKVVRLVVRVLGRGQGSTLPGAVALRIAPALITRLSQQVPERVIVTGTNGKTTTTQLIASIVRAAGQDIVANETSANLASGVASMLARAASASGRLHAQVLILEIDEHVLPGIAEQVQPTLICFTNLFRDQLDRYGEVQNVARRWKKAIKGMQGKGTIVINANDPHLSLLARAHAGQVRSFGVPGGVAIGRANHSASDAVRCTHCGAALVLGTLRCASCSFTTATPDVALTEYRPRGAAFEASRLTLVVHSKRHVYDTHLVGRYNALNVAAAVTVAQVLGIAAADIQKGVAQTRRVFGRSESFTANGRTVLLHLAKNPTGYNEVLASIADVDKTPAVLLALNDNWADGQDISWIWDVDFEQIAPQLSDIRVTGQRAGDLALRLEVAGVARDIAVEPTLEKAFDQSTGTQPLHIIASYTAMLMLRQLFAKRTYVPRSWHA
jgi:UDP-N-acetylmuramyl tripeptide synthase